MAILGIFMADESTMKLKKLVLLVKYLPYGAFVKY